MAIVAMEVPPALVAVLRENAMLLYQATAESLHHTLDREAEDGAFSGELHRHRERLAALDAVIAQLGWPDGGSVEPALELEGPRELLHDVVYGALIDAGERLVSACQGGAAGARSDEIQAAAQEVIALDRLRAGTAG